jgi:hypothetical protein
MMQGFGLCPSSGVLKPENTTLRKLGLFLSSDEGGDTYCVWFLRTAFLKLWFADCKWSLRSALVVLQKICMSQYSWKSQRLEITHGNHLSLLPVLTFYEIYDPSRLPTVLSATKEGFKALWPWCFSQSFPCTSGTTPVTQPGTAQIHNSGPMYRTFFSCINDFLSSFADTQSELSAHWNGHVPRMTYTNNRTCQIPSCWKSFPLQYWK